MEDVPGDLHPPLHQGQARAHDRWPVGLEDVLPDDDVGRPGLVLQGHEDHPLGRAGPLAHQDQASHGGAAPVPHPLQVRRRAGTPRRQFLAQEGAGVGLQGQAQGAVVLGGLPGGAHERQVDPGLGQVGPRRQGRVPVRPVGAGQSLHRPQGLAAAHPQAGEGVGLGQELHPPSAHHPGEVSDGAGPPGPGQDQALDVLLGQAPHLSQAQPHGPQPSAWNRLQGAVPVAGQDVGGAHLHPVLPGVPHQLGGRVEAHGLGVDQGRAEGVGPAPLHPGRGVDQQGEADGVALGEAVGAEPLDLAEAALGEVRVVAPPGHALQEAAAIFTDAPQVAEGGHGPAQAVGVVLAEPGRLDGQAHGLLLEEGHAQGLAQYPVQLVRRAVLR